MAYLALGDSYTIGEAVEQNNSFPFLLAEQLNLTSPQIIAKTGWTTKNLLNAISETHTEKDYNFITLCIGVNNQYQGKSRMQYKADLVELFKFINSKKPNKLVCISIPNYGFTPFGRNALSYISSDLKWYNNVFKELSEKNSGIWVDIEKLSSETLRRPDLLALDRLHPSGKMYEEVVKKIVQQL